MKVQSTIDVMPGIIALVFIGGLILWGMFRVYPTFSIIAAIGGVGTFLYFALRDDPPNANKDRT